VDKLLAKYEHKYSGNQSDYNMVARISGIIAGNDSQALESILRQFLIKDPSEQSYSHAMLEDLECLFKVFDNKLLLIHHIQMIISHFFVKSKEKEIESRL
jgi:hypothetical protein